MKQFEMLATRLADTAADSVMNRGAEEAALESHLLALKDRLRSIERAGTDQRALADVRLQLARTLVSLDRGEEAWPLGRAAFDQFIALHDFELAADACDVLFQSEQPSAIAALGQGIWLGSPVPSIPSSRSSS
jgi:hypothetical protein